MRKLILVVAVGLLVTGASNSAKAISGENLLEACKLSLGDHSKYTFDQGMQFGVCIGYLRSLIETHSAIEGVWKQRKIFCIPKKVSSKQYAAIAIKAIEENPKYWHLQPATLIISKFMKTWPCLKSKK